MPTLISLKKQIATLQAQVERVTKAEMSGAIAKIRRLMDDHGVTIDHLMDSAPRRGASAKKAAASKKTVAAKARGVQKGARPAKYQDPKSGATWSGLGRIPAWIASAKSRDAFLIANSVAAAEHVALAKKAASKKVATRVVAKKVASARKVTPAKKAVSAQGTAKQTPALAKRAAAQKAPAKASRKGASSKRPAAQAQGQAAAEPVVAAS